MIMIVWYIIVVALVIAIGFLFFILYRLNIYMTKIENEIQSTKDVTENLKQTFRDVLLYDNFLLDNGKLKKTIMQKDKDLIYNGMQVEEQNLEI